MSKIEDKMKEMNAGITVGDLINKLTELVMSEISPDNVVWVCAPDTLAVMKHEDENFCESVTIDLIEGTVDEMRIPTSYACPLWEEIKDEG